MQKEASKKNKKIIILIAVLAAAVLAAGGIVLAIFLGQGPAAPVETGPVGGRPDLYWNLDRMAFTNGGVDMSSRVADANGQYHIRFAYNGETVEYATADKRLVNAIDSMDVVGLVKDDNGNIIDAVDPATVATEVARDMFVQTVTDTMLRLNSSVVMNGMENTVDICELTQMYDVTPESKNPGQIGVPGILDRILAYANDKGELTHVFIVATQPESEIYWRVDSRNVDDKGNTKREPDENGVYTILLAVNGEQVELKCKDKAVVSEIDGKKNRLSDMGLLFDEEGYITELVEASVALRGRLAGAGYHITSIEGDQYTATYMLTGSNAGKSFSFTMNAECPVYNVCPGGTATYIGEPTEIKMNDRVIVYTDLEGKPVLVYVTYRMVENAEICYNITRKYDDGETTRKTNGSGYYVFNVSIDGKQRTIRTKDKALASKLDSFSHKIVGVVLEGDIIKFVCDPIYVVGHESYKPSSTRMLYDQIGTIISFTTTGADKSTAMKNLVMSPDVKIYDVSGRPGTKIGQETTLQIGDVIRVLADCQDNVTHVFVQSSYSGCPVYYNVSRKYSSENAATSRAVDKDGYYVFDMISQGKSVTVKTKNKEIANYIDSQSSKLVALDVKNGVIRNAYPYVSAYKYGYARASAAYFERSIGVKQITVWNYLKTTTSNIKISKNLKIYNVSGVYDSKPGEITTLRQGDRVYGIATSDTAELVELYVYSRDVSSKIYVNQKRMYSSAKGETTRQPREDGYYVFDLLADGELRKFKTKSKEIATAVDANSRAFGLKLSGNVILSVYPVTGIKGVKAESITNYDIMKINGRTVSVEYKWPGSSSVGKTATVKLASNCKIYDISSYAKTFGQKTKLSEGDRVYGLKNDDGEVSHIFIKYKNTHEAGYISYCEHCKQDVYWHPYLGATYDDVHHAYLTHDQKDSDTLQISDKDIPVNERQELVLDLNGKTLTTSNRAFWVYGKLSIVDTSKAQTGKIVGSTGGKLQAIAISDGGVVNLYSGTLTRAVGSAAVEKGGGVIKVTKNTTFNMYGGTVEGGASDEGGNIHVNNATVNIYGGKITGGVADTGANIYVKGTSTLNVQGGTIDGDVAVADANTIVKVGGTAQIKKGKECGLQIPGGMLLSLKDVTKDTKICVDAAGVFTEKVSNAEEYLTNKNFYSSDELIPISNMGDALAVGKYMPCPHCGGANALFGKYTPAAVAGGAHLIVLEDMTLSKQMAIGKESDTSADVVIDLNGKTITVEKGSSTGRFALIYGTLSIMDSSTEKNGTIYSSVENISNNGGLIQMWQNSNLNIYGGTLTANDKLAASKGGLIYAGGHVTMYGGVLDGGNVKADADGGNIMVRPTGSFIMKDGLLTAGKAAQGGNIYANKNATVRLEGGVIENGTATANGGNIYVDGANVTVSENFVIKHGTADIGGNIYVTQDTAALDVQAGAQILGGTATTKAQSVYVDATAGSISVAGTVKAEKASAESEATGGDVLIEGAATNVVVTGAAKIDKLTIPEGLMITASGLTDGAKIKVEATGVFTKELETEDIAKAYETKAYFESLTTTPVTADGKVMRCGLTSAEESTATEIDRYCEHCQQNVTFKVMTQKGGALTSGHYIINENEFVFTSEYTVGSSSDRAVDVVIDLNGKTVTTASNTTRFAVVNAKLSIQDSSAEKNGKILVTGKGLTGGIIKVEGDSTAAQAFIKNGTGAMNGGHFVLYSGELKYGSATAYSGNGGVLDVRYAQCDIHGGKLTGGRVSDTGGNMNIIWAVVNIENAEITGGTAYRQNNRGGGNICIAASIVNVSNSTISGGTATANGGNILVRHANSTVTLNNVTMSGGTAVAGNDLYVMESNNVTIGGTTKANIALEGGVKLKLNALLPTALLTVAADDGAFTAENPDAQTYYDAGYFVAADAENKQISVNTSNELVIGNK